MNQSTKADWLVPASLLALALVPIAAGIHRLVQVIAGVDITPENARFLAAPMPVMLHIVSAAVYGVLGAFQFSASLRRRHPGWHRAAGRILVPGGLVAALSGLWMTQFYPSANFDGPWLYAIRLAAGSAMAICLCLGVVAIRRRNVRQHRACMLRAYALGMGAGTQVFTHVPLVVFPDLQGELARTLCMGAGWAVNLAVAEWLIARDGRRLPAGMDTSAS